MTSTDWHVWHEQYADPTSSMSQRLAAVRGLVRQHLDAAPKGPVRLVSACAGDGRDVIGALEDHPRRADVTGVLVELDPRLSAACAAGLQEAGLAGVRAQQGDAGDLTAYRGAHDADLLLLCGIFGNVIDTDIRATINNASRLCAPGAVAIWTRGRQSPDLTPTIAGWWSDAGWDEIAFVSPGPDHWSVGAHRLRVAPKPYVEDLPLFAFIR